MRRRFRRTGERPLVGDSCSKEAMRRFVACEGGRNGGKDESDFVRVWIGKGRRSLTGHIWRFDICMVVGVVDWMRDTAADEKWSDGDVGSRSPCDKGRMLRE